MQGNIFYINLMILCFYHCLFLLEMSINVDRDLDSEAKDAVAEVTDGKVKEKNGG